MSKKLVMNSFIQQFRLNHPNCRCLIVSPNPKRESPELKGLRQAVLAAPADDLPRLVYADALEEAGEQHHADFIRASIEHWHWIQQQFLIVEGNRAWEEMRIRERPLLKAWNLNWLAIMGNPPASLFGALPTVVDLRGIPMVRDGDGLYSAWMSPGFACVERGFLSVLAGSEHWIRKAFPTLSMLNPITAVRCTDNMHSHPITPRCRQCEGRRFIRRMRLPETNFASLSFESAPTVRDIETFDTECPMCNGRGYVIERAVNPDFNEYLFRELSTQMKVTNENLEIRT